MKRNWWPSVGACVWLGVFLVLTLSNWRIVLINADSDPALHWRIGNWMIEHHEIIRTDQFSHTRANAPLISKEWLSEVLYATAGNLLGWNGFVLLAAALIATTLWVLHRQLLAEGCEPLLATGLVLLAAMAMSHHWLARPHLFTHLFSVILLMLLRAFDRERLSASQLCGWFMLLMLLWTNLHGAFFTGFVIIGCYALGNLAHPRKFITLLAVTVAGLLASLINPNGWKLHAQIISFVRSPLLAGYANEFRSPDFHSGGMHGFLLLLLVLVLVLVVVRPRLRATDITLLAVWGYFALHSVRNVPIFTIAAVPILGEDLSLWLREHWCAGHLPATRRFSEGLVVWQQGRTGLIVIALTIGIVVAVMHAGRLTTDLQSDRVPTRAVEFLRDHPERVHGAMFNSYGWGGSLLLELPDRKVFVDSRNDFYGAEFMKEFDTVDHLKAGWEQVLEKYHVGWTILPVEHPLNSLLTLEPDRWTEVYRDKVAVIFTRASN